MKIYRNCFIWCNTKKVIDQVENVEEGVEEISHYELDIPFKTYHNEIFCYGVRHYHQCPQEQTEVMASISYHPDDEEIVKSFEGYMGMTDEVETIMAHPKYAEHWLETQEEAYAVDMGEEYVAPEKSLLGKVGEMLGMGETVVLSKCSEILKLGE